MQKKTVKQLKKAQKLNRNESLAEYLNFLMSGQVEDEAAAKRINAIAKKTPTFAEASAIAKILVAQFDHKLSQVMEAVRVQQIVLEKLEATDEMFEEAQAQYDKELEEVQKAMEQLGKTKEEVPEYDVPEESYAPAEEEVTDETLETLKEALEEHDA